MGITNLDRLDVNRLHLSGAALAFNAFSYDLYVNGANPAADDDVDGDDPEYPLETIQGAVDRALELGVQGIRIFIAPGTYNENVVTPDSLAGINNLEFIGLGHINQPFWTSPVAATPCLDVRLSGCRIAGIHFGAPTASGGITLRYGDTAAGDLANYALVEDCLFDGQTTGLVGITTHGAFEVTIRNNRFVNIHNAGGTARAILAAAGGLAAPYRNHIEGNKFYDCDGFIDGAAVGFNGCDIQGNVLESGFVYTPTVYIDTSAGDDNAIHGNWCGGAFSAVGGYVTGAADSWWGNYANVAGGITQAQP